MFISKFIESNYLKVKLFYVNLSSVTEGGTIKVSFEHSMD
ncbi:LLM class flavin-dependent oxidoreductase, partial [Bacillus pumilus sxm20-2]|nr:LLM class flavin-dependent oxidoreductase [Bacillus pumilus sxm20-2]